MASSWASLILDLDAACLRIFVPEVAAPVETFFFLLIMDSFALHLAGVVAGAPCIRFRCPNVQVEAQIMPLLSSLPASHSMAGKRGQNQGSEGTILASRQRVARTVQGPTGSHASRHL